ncbi:MAG: tRNA (adenosine(37)-N6)-threonylcarbamoyltransferase complex ATPase subunit type 1 TsaE [Candidatus Taylorbacteria bacterium]|nr:tRNA (adenosine(37)-N6)-threonylcarbamoyltransferase complex ATPase subunit type 1 TsaE [Candidatus Taylorbacteria bacterium]
MEFTSRSLAETEILAQRFMGELEARAGRATIVGLSGDLGSGKTAFVHASARTLGVVDKITSPTFVIIKTYDLAGKPWKRMVHIDAYRLKSGKELAGLKFGDLATDPGNIIFIEWRENVAEILPKDAQNIDFKFVSENVRQIKIPSPTE